MLTTYVTTACDNRTQSAAGGKLHLSLSLSLMHEAQIAFACTGEHTACSLSKHISLFLHKLKYTFWLNLFYVEVMQSQITEKRIVSSVLNVSNKQIISVVKPKIHALFSYKSFRLTSRGASWLGGQVAPWQGRGRGRLEAVAATRCPPLVFCQRRAGGHSVKWRLLAHTQTCNTQN